MTIKHSLISPSNFERRMLCPGSLNAEKDLPDVPSKYSEEGTMLHKATAQYLYHKSKVTGKPGDILRYLSEEHRVVVKTAADYCLFLIKLRYNSYEQHEKTFDLSFIYPGMRGTADTVLIKPIDDSSLELHIIDYKFGKGVPVFSYQNFQLILYYLGVINDSEVKEFIGDRKYSVHLHIVQPYINNSRWDLTEEERLEIEDLQSYKDVVRACFAPDAKRIASKKACQFCKAKPTCPALAKTLPNLDIDVFDLEDEEIAAIYDNRELIKLYLSSIEEYIKNKLSNEGFKGYEFVNKLSNRKWNNDALTKLPNLLGDAAYETNKKLISISKAERLLGKNSDIINTLTTKEIIGVEIVKITDCN